MMKEAWYTVIKLNKIENAEFITRDFRPLVKNKTIDFPASEKNAVRNSSLYII